MVGADQTTSKDEDILADEDEAQGRQRSTIGFPYMDLADAVEVAQAIYGNVGQGECEEDQLAAWLGLSPKSSGFRVRLSTARMFGVIEGGGSNLKVTPLGRQIVDPNQARAAKIKAFLNVPLYRAIFDNYKADVLPPPAALERDIMGLGVAEKQKGRARQVFERAAEQAGFFEQGKNRLVKPGVADTGNSSENPPPPPPLPGGGNGNDGDGGQDKIDPIIMGLLRRLPKPGSEWPEGQRAIWLELLKGSFKLIYTDTTKTDPKKQS